MLAWTPTRTLLRQYHQYIFDLCVPAQNVCCEKYLSNTIIILFLTHYVPNLDLLVLAMSVCQSITLVQTGFRWTGMKCADIHGPPDVSEPLA